MVNLSADLSLSSLLFPVLHKYKPLLVTGYGQVNAPSVSPVSTENKVRSSQESRETEPGKPELETDKRKEKIREGLKALRPIISILSPRLRSRPPNFFLPLLEYLLAVD